MGGAPVVVNPPPVPVAPPPPAPPGHWRPSPLPEPRVLVATVTWTPPTTNTDGSTLTDLGGYTIYYGQHTFDMQAVTVGAGLTAYSIELEKGTWIFQMDAFNTEGVHSARTGLITWISPR